jgi:MFS family permease
VEPKHGESARYAAAARTLNRLAGDTNALDWVNFFLADVRGGMGAYIGVLLFTHARWSQATIGVVFTLSGLVGIIAHPLIGDFIDRTHAKRAVLVCGVMTLAGSGVAIILWPNFRTVLAADIVMAVLGGVFAPTVAAITLGLCERDTLPNQLARNAAFDRAGNIFIAALFGVVGVFFSQETPFFLFAPTFAVLTSIAVLSIPASAINHERARGGQPRSLAQDGSPKNWRVLLSYRSLLVFGASTMLFHFANAPMLPLVVQKISFENPGWESGLTSIAIIITQAVTILMAALVSRANAIGRKPLLIIAFAALPLRIALCFLSEDPVWLLAIQVLDGVGGGFFEALLPLVLADIMIGTGHYSLARGALGAVQGVGGSSSQAVAGYIVATVSYHAAFLALGLVAAVALLVICLAMPETRPNSS